MYFWPFCIWDFYSFAQSFERTQTHLWLRSFPILIILTCPDIQTLKHSFSQSTKIFFNRLISPRSKAWRPESMTSTLASQAGKKRPGSPIRGEGEILSLCQVEKRMPIFLLFRNIVKITGFGRKKLVHESMIIQVKRLQSCYANWLNRFSYLLQCYQPYRYV